MRVNVYTEEIEHGDNGRMAEVVFAEYVSSRTGQPMRNYGLRIYLKSYPGLHYIPGRDDDRSAVTIWCGPKVKDMVAYIDRLRDIAYAATLDEWRYKTEKVQQEAEAALLASHGGK